MMPKIESTSETSAELREWAARCVKLAEKAVNEIEKQMLQRKAEALLALAETEDWLAGRTWSISLGVGQTARSAAAHGPSRANLSSEAAE